MYLKKVEMLIDGRWCQGSDSISQPIVNPATEDILAEVPHASASDLDVALNSSAEGFGVWRNTPAVDRQAVMEKAARLIESRVDEISKILTLEMGKPLSESKIELDFVIQVLRWYAEEGKRAYGRIVPSRVPGTRQLVLSEPVGPSCAFVPWNFPGVNVIRKVAGALGAGCSMLIKPSEETPGTAVSIAKCFQDAGLPPGVLNVVFGDPEKVSSHILSSRIPKKMSFTGSVPVGKHLQKLAADTMKRCTMELGGHSPFIVFDDADLESALNYAANFKFRNAGQVCISPTRFFIQEKVYKDFVEGVTERAKSIIVGNGMDDGVQMGPLIADRRLPIMEDFVKNAKDSGAEIKTGGERIGNQGYFYAPTVLSNVPDDAKIMLEEPFGPIIPVTHFNTFDEVVERANSLPFGLSSYAFTSSGETASRIGQALDSGMVGINHTMVATPETPFGGVNDSGYGSEGGIEGLDEYLRTKFITELGV